MFLCLKRRQRLVEPRGLMVGVCLFPLSLVGIKGVENLMFSEILRCLVLERVPDPGRVKKCEPERVVFRLIGAEFRILKDRYAVSAVRVGQVEPLVRGNLVFFLIVVASPDRSDPGAVCRERIGYRERKRLFQRTIPL